MQLLTFILYQLDEASHYIEEGRVEQLRLALLILDNAAELQLDRRVREELQTEELREGLRTTVINVGGDPPSELKDLIDWQPLSRSAKRRLRRNFDEKLTFLTDRHGILDPGLGTVLQHLHRYRNEAYHEGRVRRETIRTAALILFEANCQLLLTIFRVAVYSSADDYSWLSSRFGVEPRALFFGRDLRMIVDDLRSHLLPESAAVAENLSAHLHARIDDLWDALDFIADNAEVQGRAEAFKLVQMDSAEMPDVERWREALAEFVAPWKIADVEALESDIASVGSSTELLQAFEVFSALEARLEPFEESVHGVAADIEAAIQQAVDIARGK